MVVAGGGFAALEAVLALRALAGDRVRLTLVAPKPAFAYRPAATAEVFTEAAPLIYDLREIAANLDATYRPFALEAVSPREQEVRLSSGLTLEYDYLVLATGVRAVAAVPGAFTFRDQRDAPRFRVILDQLAAGAFKRLVFAVPSTRCWPLPAYELALLSSLRAQRHAAETEISVVTPESKPLAVFGDHASETIAELLADRGMRFVGSSLPHSVGRDGSLALQFDGSIPADRVVAVPELHAPRIAGIPATWSGFVSTDRLGRVEGLSNVLAAGDMTTFPIKQGGIAAQQADLAAHTIAGELGADIRELRDTRVLRARLMTGDGAFALRTELDGLGRPIATSTEHRESRQAEDLKVFGRYLTPYLSLHGSRLLLKAAAA